MHLLGFVQLNFACSEHKLQATLFENYNKEIRPVKKQSTLTVVEVFTHIYSILSIVSETNRIVGSHAASVFASLLILLANANERIKMNPFESHTQINALLSIFTYGLLL